MQSLLFAMAAVICAATFVVHVFVGGRFAARPLLADAMLTRASKWLNYYCWHITSVMIAAVALAFVRSATSPDAKDLAVFCTALTAAVSVLSVVVTMKGAIHPLRFPSTSLFAAAAACGLGGLLVG